MSLLAVKDLQVQVKTQKALLTIIHGIDFQLNAGEILGIVGESGSGKSQTALALMGLSGRHSVIQGSIQFEDRELVGLSHREYNKIRGNQIAMVFQDPMTSLNPYLKISKQMSEILVRHRGMSHRMAKQHAIQMLDAVKIPEAKRRIGMYPHEFSGGMRQRVMVAMALLCQPKVLIADEPTTALDVTVQAEILHLMKDLRKEFNTAIILITHDLGVIANLCERVMVMYAGRLMEEGHVDDILYHPMHPYTTGLLRALPRLGEHQTRLEAIEGSPPNVAKLPTGCPFHPRCPKAQDICRERVPDIRYLPHGQQSACHFTNFESVIPAKVGIQNVYEEIV